MGGAAPITGTISSRFAQKWSHSVPEAQVSSHEREKWLREEKLEEKQESKMNNEHYWSNIKCMVQENQT